MIVAAIEIENYKQYAGCHRIEFPEAGIVSVTGPNGAGKTTLFEAIEWCLYCPLSIPQVSVPPHDGSGRTVVRVTLEDSNDGKRYCVQRELRTRGTQAEIYLEDDPGQPIVQGSREVTRYVARHLVGLPHRAFVATFFTKQRELQFFGDRTATERRTEVGRLLGLEAVRDAQREIGEGRTAARMLAEARLREYERRLGDRDLEAEVADGERAIQESEAREAAAAAAAKAAADEAERLHEQLDRMRDLQARDAAFLRQLADLAGARAAAVARRESAVAELNRLESRAGERMRLAAIASTLVERTADVERQERERDRARQLAAAQDAAARAREAGCRIVERTGRLVEEHRDAARGLAGWEWTVRDGERCAEELERLHATASAIEHESRRKRAERMQETIRLAGAVNDLSQRLTGYHRHREKLIGEREAKLATGDPAQAVEEATRILLEQRETEHKARMSLAAVRTRKSEDEALAASLREHAQEAVCPTCARALGREEAQRLIEMIEARLQLHAEEERDLTEIATRARRAVESAEREESAARERWDEIRTLETRLAEGEKLIEEAEARNDEAVAALRNALEAIGAVDVPTVEETEAALLEAENALRIAGLAGLLDRLRHDAEAAQQEWTEAQSRIDELGTVAFDEDQLSVAVAALNEARDAAAQVVRIDVELADRGDYEGQRAEADGNIARIKAQETALGTEREQLGFDAAALDRVLIDEKAARSAAVEARDQHATARTELRDARSSLDRLIAEHEVLRNLVQEADTNAREADELTRMYDEFGEFDRYVARQVGPLLSDTTERMLAQVTNGKFDHVAFDENYGIEVYDGDEAFPLANFSGGERDVVALCARLALSEVVGSAAVRPPRFLVLDEVFGSLDGERRSQLLETLGGLASSGHFRQMFIISHVDDVQQSPVMTEAWTVEERDGVSRIIRPEHYGGRL